MTTIATNYGTATAIAAASSIAAGNYDLTATTVNSRASGVADVLVDYYAVVAANPTGNKQIIVFVQGAMDSISWATLPTSATDTTHDTSMRLLGTIACNGGASSVAERPIAPFSVAAAFGGVLPAFWRIIVKNDCGVAMTACAARMQEINLTAV